VELNYEETEGKQRGRKVTLLGLIKKDKKLTSKLTLGIYCHSKKKPDPTQTSAKRDFFLKDFGKNVLIDDWFVLRPPDEDASELS
jgi:hypothetical protein